ncbi:unnamed protein product [Peniophora sp. CBMAI 1063]|nr:unnamed protein product [Peniophora sp. CBMAI 1063]
MPSGSTLPQPLQPGGSSASQTAATVEQLLSSLPGLTGDRYIAIFCIVVAIWEHILNFDNELRLIWSHHRKTTWVTRALYVFLRYTVTSLAVLTLIVVCNMSSRDDSKLYAASEIS